MEGRLFAYQRGLCAFQSGDRSSDKHLVVMGGLTDGLLATPYVTVLAAAAAAAGWAVTQPMFSSSCLGYGISSLERDCTELDALISVLLSLGRDGSDDSANSSSSRKRLVLLGHSTGCQIAVAYLRDGMYRAIVSGAVLQAPVSDREYLATLPATASNLAAATKLLDVGRGEELLPRAADDAPICAARYASLAGRGGADDMFSSDLSAPELHAALGHTAALASATGGQLHRLLLLSSGADEYVPAHVDAPMLLERLCAAMRGEMASNGSPAAVREEGWCRGVVLDGADHSVSGDAPQQQLLGEVLRLLAEVAAQKK